MEIYISQTRGTMFHEEAKSKVKTKIVINYFKIFIFGIEMKNKVTQLYFSEYGIFFA